MLQLELSPLQLPMQHSESSPIEATYSESSHIEATYSESSPIEAIPTIVGSLNR